MGIDAVQELSDLDILRQIRDANPDSVLNTDKTWIENTVLTAWLESRDPNTWWGVTWNNGRVEGLTFHDYGVGPTNIYTLPNINLLSRLKEIKTEYSLQQNVILSGLNYLQKAELYSNNSYDKTLDISNCPNLIELIAYGNSFASVNISGCQSLTKLILVRNTLSQLSTLTSKGLITEYDFTYNNFSTAELDRLRTLGFTDESKLLPQYI